MTVQARVSAAAPARVQRTDIQALRAIAVILVVLDHLVLLQRLPGNPQGGFVGVDVFFVISGFLITQHLVSENLKNGRISFRNFYVRRARRILPMAFLVIAVTVCCSFAVFWPWQAASFSLDALWSALFVSNIAFAVRGVDYFAPEHASILQHYWSLSVEEQFYLAWPLLIVALGYFAHRATKARGVFLAGIVGVGGLSFVWACISTVTSPTTAYFSTFARAFEFAIGGAVAMLVPVLHRIPDPARRWLSVAGLAAIGASVWVIVPDVGFPGPTALLPTLGAALAIAAGSGTDRHVAPWPMNTRPVTYVGDVSYSLYLWHWPVIMFVAAFVPRDIVLVPAALLLSFSLSALSYRCIERPVLASGWLQGDRRSTTEAKRQLVRGFTTMGVGVLVAGAVVGGGDAVVRAVDASRTDNDTVGGTLSLQLPQPPEAIRLVEHIQDLVARAQARTDWSGLTPDVSNVKPYEGDLVEQCWTRPGDEPRTCLRGNPAAEHTIAVLGDSIALNASFSVEEFVRQHPDWNLAVYAKLGCAAPRVPTSAPDGSIYVDCDEFRSWALRQIADQRPDAVWITSAEPRKLRGIADSDVFDVWAAGLGQTLDELAAVPRVFVVTPPPPGHDLAFCSRPFNQPADCASRITQFWSENRDVLRRVAEGRGRTFVDTGMWFCNTDGLCPAVIGDYIPRRDERHLTFDYGKFLAPLVAAWVLSGGTH